MKRLAFASLLAVLTVVPFVSLAAQQDSQLQDAHRLTESFVGDWRGSVAWQKESESEPGIMETQWFLIGTVSIEQPGQHTIITMFSCRPPNDDISFSFILEYDPTQKKYMLTYKSDVFPNFERLPLTYSDEKKFSGKGEVAVGESNMTLEVTISAVFKSGVNTGSTWSFVALDSDGERYISHELYFESEESRPAIPSTVAARTSFAVDRGSLGISGMASIRVADGKLYEDTAGDPLVSLSFMPSIFYFIAPNLAVGGDLVLEHTFQGDDSASMYGIGPGILYAFGNAESSTYPYIGASFAHVTYENSISGEVDGRQIRLGGGLFILPSSQQHIGLRLEAGVTYVGVAPEHEKSTYGTTFRISVGLVGFMFK